MMTFSQCRPIGRASSRESNADEIATGMRRAREVLAGGDADNIVAYLLNEPLDNVKRVTGVSSLVSLARAESTAQS